MPNWTENTLIISVPGKAAEALLSDMSGPNDWAYPSLDFQGGGLDSLGLSNHQRLLLLDRPDIFVAQFGALKARLGWPEWMRPSHFDLALMLADPARLERPSVPFSVARLSPWRDVAEFERFFPSRQETESDRLLWRAASEAEINSGNLGPIALRHHKIGVKWPPSAILLDEENAGDRRRRFRIRYQTPWGPITSLSEILAPVLARHAAKACLIWIEEDAHTGYDHIDPGAEIARSDEFDRDDFLKTVSEDGDEWQRIDINGLRKRIDELVNDPHLAMDPYLI